MRKGLSTLAFALMITTAPLALAQTNGSSQGGAPEAAPARHQGAAEPGKASWEQRYQAQLRKVAPELRPRVEQRMAPNQRPLEIAQTIMLNEFGAMGFARLDDMAKSGNTYVANVETRQGQRETLVIDPTTAKIRSEGQSPGQPPGPGQGQRLTAR